MLGPIPANMPTPVTVKTVERGFWQFWQFMGFGLFLNFRSTSRIPSDAAKTFRPGPAP